MVYWILRNHKIIIDWLISGHVRCVSWVEFNNCLIRSTYTRTWTLRLCFCVNVMGQKVHWLLTCVLSNNMSFTTLFSNKIHGAVSALKRSFSSVSSNVSITISLCWKLFMAEFAFVRFFSSVSSNMLVTTIFLCKLHGAESTLLWLFSRVSSNMLITILP